MTYGEAKERRFTYSALFVLTFAFGLPILVTTILKSFHVAVQSGSLPFIPFGGIVRTFYYNIPVVNFVVQQLWPWMSVVRYFIISDILLCPSLVVGEILLIIAFFFLQNAIRLSAWMQEARELHEKEKMRDSLKPPSSRQSIGNVQAGGDANIKQEITNHYNHRPDNPRTPIVVAFIGAAAAIVAALLGKGR